MSINLTPDNEETELQRLVLNSDEKFTTLTQDLVMMHLLDMQERTDGVENPHGYIDDVPMSGALPEITPWEVAG